MPRATGDFGVWIRPTPENAARTLRALAAFGAPLTDLTVEDLTRSDTVFQIGLPPRRIDILSGITGVTFEDAWSRRVPVVVSGHALAVLSKADFIANKTALGRPKDLADIAMLAEVDASGSQQPPNDSGTP